MILDLNKCFPEAQDGSRSPLPKQQQFLDLALKLGGPKYVRYVGGIGSGKTQILCATILTLALMYPGDYLIGRLYMPELRDTALKTFLEIIQDVGPGLMIEYRAADAIVVLRSRGGTARILFRGLDEPDKLRSLNLNAFGIEEAQQVSEAAFLLLQGRLRGKYVRKGLLCQNSGGHDWTWRYFVKQDMFKNEEIKKAFVNIRAPSNENKHLPPDYVATALASWSEDRIRREIYADEDAFEGQVYAEFRRDTHVIKPFVIPDTWTRVVGADHGYRNPACWLWGAVDYDGNMYVYREFYKKEWLIEEIVKGNKKTKEPGVLTMMKGETIEAVYLDPATNRRNGTTGESDWDTYLEHLPTNIALIPAKNDKTPGIDRVKTYLKTDTRTNKPRLFIFDTCSNLLEEIAKYRYDDLPSSQMGKKAEKEEPRKVDDHAMDALRYLVMSRPEEPTLKEDIYDRIKYNSLEGSLYRDLQTAKKPRRGDVFGD